MRRLLYVCLDGVGDDPIPEFGNRTPLEAVETPFLDSLAARSLFLRRHYANGRRSVEAMPSILAGLPSLRVTGMPLASVTCRTARSA